MKLLSRHKQFIKECIKVKLTENQFSKFIHFLDCLQKEDPLPSEALDHPLHGVYKDCREFHLGGDMLVIYLPKESENQLLRMGTHSQLFK